ncbi:hypothetical protein JCM12141A_63720 [Mycolicibacterium hodleri]
MAPKHGEPESVVKNITTSTMRTIFTAIVLVVVAGVITALVVDHFWGNQQAVDHENAIQSDKDQHDAGLNSPVDIHSSLPLAPWKAWVSNETIAVDPEITDEMGFPGDDHAVHTGRPTDVADGKTQYRSSFSFDITGKSNTTIRAQAMRAVIDANDPTPSATFMYYIPQGDTLKGQFIIDLGSKNLDALAMDDDGHATDQRYLDARELTVANMESVGFQGIAAAPPDRDIKFHIEIDFDGGKKAEVYGPDGNPFRAVGFPESPQHVFEPTALQAGGSTGLHECQWSNQCEMSFNSYLRDGP